MRSIGPVVLFLAVAGAAGGGWYALSAEARSGEPAAGAETGVGADSPAGAADPLEAALKRDQPEKKPDTSRMLALPDGGFLPMLNGCEPTKDTGWWPREVPWSPIVRKVTKSDGDWYMHEDGSWTTMSMMKMKPDEAPQTVIRVHNKAEALALAPDDQARIDAELKRGGGAGQKGDSPKAGSGTQVGSSNDNTKLGTKR